MSFRYQKLNLYAERKPVKTFEGVDPLTGLPVLVYEFQAAPRNKLELLESQNIPGILDIEVGDTSLVAVAYSKRYKAVTRPFRVPKHTLLLDSARALRDAARVGIVHGDIRPDRFLSTQDHVLLEGFGMPWGVIDNPYRAPETKYPNLSDDVYAWAKSILDLVSGDLSEAQSSLLTQCLLANPNDRPDAETLFMTLENSIQQDEQNPQANKQSMNDFHLSFDENSMKTSGFQEAAEPASFSNEATPNVTTSKAEEAKQELPRRPEMDTSAKSTFIKNPPPGATYKTGEAYPDAHPSKMKLEQDLATLRSDLESGSGKRRRGFLFGGLLLAVLALAALALVNQLFNTSALPQAAPSTNVTQYIVRLEVSPASLPPVDIIVIESPAGSSLVTNQVLGKYPAGTNQVVLDREGLWRFQARFENSVSEIVSLQLPAERSVVLSILEEETE